MNPELKRLAGPVRQARLPLHGRAFDDEISDEAESRPSRALRSMPIRTNDATPPVSIPPGHIGPVVLPGTGRLVYWTGRVAIGLRHQPERRDEAVPQSALWVQDLMLGPGQAVC